MSYESASRIGCNVCTHCFKQFELLHRIKITNIFHKFSKNIWLILWKRWLFYLPRIVSTKSSSVPLRSGFESLCTPFDNHDYKWTCQSVCISSQPKRIKIMWYGGYQDGTIKDLIDMIWKKSFSRGHKSGRIFNNITTRSINSFQFYAETIIRHDSMDEVEFSGCEPNYCYQRDVTYSATLQQIVALIDASEECRQFIKVMRFLLFTYSCFDEEQQMLTWVFKSGWHLPPAQCPLLNPTVIVGGGFTMLLLNVKQKSCEYQFL